MRVYVRKWRGKQWCVWFKQGVQEFRLDFFTTKTECQWMAQMLRKALRAHDTEQAGRRKRKRK